MRFLVYRSSGGAVSQQPPCRGAVRASEASAWPGEYEWFVDLNSLEDLITFLNDNDGALGLFAPDPGEKYPAIEIFDELDEEDDTEGDE